MRVCGIGDQRSGVVRHRPLNPRQELEATQIVRSHDQHRAGVSVVGGEVAGVERVRLSALVVVDSGGAPASQNMVEEPRPV